MNRSSRAALALAAIVVLAFSASAYAQAAAPAQTPTAVPWVTPYRGVAEVEYLAPKTAVDFKAGKVTTTIEVKNITKGALIRLTIEEFWWDKSGNPVTGGKAFCKMPLKFGESYIFTIVSPKDPKMFKNNYKFSHANGDVKPKLVKKFS